MRINRWHFRRQFLMIVLAALGISGADIIALPSYDARQIPPPILILDDDFLPEDWSDMAEINGDASYTVDRQLTGGFGSPPFRLMSHRLAPTSGFTTIAVTHVFLGYSYDPAVQGPISSIDYTEAGIILSFPFDNTFTTTQPVVIQNGVEYRPPKFLRFIALNGSHEWEQNTLDGLTAADFHPPGGAENDHPDFSANGSPILFGFTRTNSRGSSLPPVPADEDMIINHGIDHWSLIVYREEEVEANRPPQAADDVFILDGENRTLPLLEIFDLVRNDTDPDQDRLEIIDVTGPEHGSAGILSSYSVAYQLAEAVATDDFTYTISDDEFNSSARVDVLIDCACTVLCLNQLALPLAATEDMIDLPLIYRFRDRILKSTYDGERYVDMYYTNNPEILLTIMSDETLRSEAVDTLKIWQENFRSLTDSDGSAVITQAQIDALEMFLSHLSAESSAELQQVIAGELLRIGPLEEYLGLTMEEAKVRTIGDPQAYVPFIRR